MCLHCECGPPFPPQTPKSGALISHALRRYTCSSFTAQLPYLRPIYGFDLQSTSISTSVPLTPALSSLTCSQTPHQEPWTYFSNTVDIVQNYGLHARSMRAYQAVYVSVHADLGTVHSQNIMRDLITRVQLGPIRVQRRG